jgi:PAS domain S-box-containing protein
VRRDSAPRRSSDSESLRRSLREVEEALDAVPRDKREAGRVLRRAARGLRRVLGSVEKALAAAAVVDDSRAPRLAQHPPGDVIDPHRKEEALRQSEERFQVALKNSPLAVFQQDRDLRYTWFYNSRFLADEDYVGRKNSDLFPPVQASRLDSLARRVLEIGGGVREEVELSFGRHHAVFDLMLEPLQDSSGARIGVTGAAFDVTERRALEEGLRHGEARLREAQELLHLGGFEWELDGDRMTWSPELYRLYGLDARNVRPSFTALLERLHPEDREVMGATVQRMLASEHYQEATVRIAEADGGTRYIYTRGRAIRDGSGRPVRIVGTHQDVTETVFTHERLHGSEAMLAQAQQIAHLGSWQLEVEDPKDLSRGRLTWSDEVFRIFGYEPKGLEVSLDRFYDAVLPADREAVRRAMLERITGPQVFFVAGEAGVNDLDSLAVGTPYALEYRVVRPDGTERTVFEQAEVRRDERGGPLHMIGTVLDITDLKQAEARFRELFETVPIGILQTAMNGAILAVNPTALEMLGYGSAEEVRDTHFSALYADSMEGESLFERLQNEGIIRGAQLQLRRKDGSSLWGRLSLRAVVDPGGQPLRIEGAIEDVTERRRAEEALRESETRLQVALRNLPVTVFMQNRDLRYTWIHNTDGAFDPQEVVGRTDADLFPPEEAEELMRVARQVIETGRGERTEVGLTLRGERRFSDVTLEPLRDAKGVVIGIAGVTFDVTERRAMEAELVRARDAALEASRLKSAFLANMSHEIRTPLNVILGFTGLLADTLEPPDDSKRKLIDTIRRASRRLLMTVQGILDMSRIETGAFEIHPVSVDVAKIVSEQVHELEPQARAKGLALECRLGAERPVVVFDEYCLRGALINLIDNAIKFTASGSVVVTVDGVALGDVSVEVTDTGVGIASSYLPRLFEPFTQEESGYSRAFDGTGLGLALTREYLERNGARIEVESEKGKGSRFRIAIPRPAQLASATVAGPSKAPAAKCAPAGDRTPSILLVEDDTDNQELVLAMLAERYGVVVAASVTEARQQLAIHSGEIQVILLDLSLRGDEDGLAFARWARSSESWSSVPIIAVTAHAFDTDRERALAAGCDGFIAKPFDRAEVVARLEELLPATSQLGTDPRNATGRSALS